LPAKNLTTQVLEALDFVVPGEWQNVVGFENTVRQVTGETDEGQVQRIVARAIHLYGDESQGYRRAMWIYQTVDNVDQALAAAALAHKVGDRIKILSFLSRITPKADMLQTVDISLKLVSELAAFCFINGLPRDSIGDFAKSLADYGGESLMRMAALLAIDGLIPLGPDFLGKVATALDRTKPRDLEKNQLFQRISNVIPGDDSAAKLGFISKSFGSVSGWMDNFVQGRSLTRDRVLDSIQGFVEFSDDKLDYLAALLDVTTNYYEHTGTQTLARRLIEHAAGEV
jgi:hypothetical protein